MQDKWIDLLFNVIQSLLVAGITGLVVILISKRYLSKVLFASQLKSYGFDGVIATHLSERDLRLIFEKADVIKIVYVTGMNFLRINKRYIEDACTRKSPPQIKYLCSAPNTSFLSDIEKMEIEYGCRARHEDMSNDVGNAFSILTSLSGYDNFKVRMFNTQFRMPIILAEYYKKDCREIDEIRAWLTITLPPYKSKESFILVGRCKLGYKQELRDDNKTNFIEMMETHFDSAWRESEKFNLQVPMPR